MANNHPIVIIKNHPMVITKNHPVIMIKNHPITTTVNSNGICFSLLKAIFPLREMSSLAVGLSQTFSRLGITNLFCRRSNLWPHCESQMLNCF